MVLVLISVEENFILLTYWNSLIQYYGSKLSEIIQRHSGKFSEGGNLSMNILIVLSTGLFEKWSSTSKDIKVSSSGIFCPPIEPEISKY